MANDMHYKLGTDLTTIPYDSIKYSKKQIRSIRSTLPNDLQNYIRNVCKDNSMAIYTLILASLKIFLFKYTSQNKIVILSPSFNLCSNKLDCVVLEDYLSYELSFIDTLFKIKRTVISSCNDFNNHRIEEDIESRVILTYDAIHTEERVEKIKNKFQWDVHFHICNNDNRLCLFVEYKSHYKRKTILAICECIIHMIRQSLKRPNILIKDLKFIENEKDIILQFNNIDVSFPKNKTINDIFDEVVMNNPLKTAIRVGNESYSYIQLKERANQIANYLLMNGVGLSEIIAIFVYPTFDTIACILGIIKAGCVYLPLDPKYPTGRILEMIVDCNVQYIVNDSVMREGYFHINSYDSNICGMPCDNPNIKFDSNTPAYIIYTSGSTAFPKGVPITHRNVVRLLFHDNNKFDFSNTETWTLFHSLCFDFSVWELYGCFLYGGTLCLVDDDIKREPLEYCRFIIQNRVSILNFTPEAFYCFMSAIESIEESAFDNIKYIIFGGDKLEINVLRKWMIKFPRIKFINMYGITETTVHTTYKMLTLKETYEECSVIGTPLPTTAAYILSDDMNILPPGLIGEIFVGGFGLSNGYLNQPMISKATYVTNPFDESDFLYKSGDYGRINDDGDIVYVGRRDFRVKIRGYRVGLEEVEHSILNYESIQNAVVVYSDDALYAYILSVYNIDLSKVRTWLSSQLPEYMVPDYIYQLPEFPITKNGKIDREALKKQHIVQYSTNSNQLERPKTNIECILSDIVRDILKIADIDITASFFNAGGNSLKAVLLSVRIQEAFNVSCPVSVIFNLQNIRDIGEYIENANGTQPPYIIPLTDSTYYDVSPAQRRIYVLSGLTQSDVNTAYNIPTVICVCGSINKEKMQGALDELIIRHEVLTSSFHLIENEVKQKINRGIRINIEWKQLNDDAIDAFIQNFSIPFDLSKAPLLRVAVIESSNEKYYIILDIHHIICDGVSSWILIRDFLRLYSNIKLPKCVQFKDYTKWQNDLIASEYYADSETYWLERFAGEIPILNMETDYDRGNKKSFEGDSIVFELDSVLFSEIKNAISCEKITMFSFLVAAVNILLMKYTGQNDIIIGSPSSGRMHSDVNNTVGMFLNILPLRNFPKNSMLIRQFLNEVQKSVIEALEHQNYQYDILVSKLELNRILSRNPLFDVFFILQNYEIPSLNLDSVDFQVQYYNFKNKTTKFDITIQAIEHEEGIEFTFEYCTALFKKETICLLATHYFNVIREICAKINNSIRDIKIITNEELDLVNKCNETLQLIPRTTVKNMLIEAMNAHSDLIALVDNGIQITYKDLNEKSNYLANQLKRQGILNGEVVAIYMDRSVELIITMVAVIKCGATYLPIDGNLPLERIKLILEDSNASYILKTKKNKLAYSNIPQIDIEIDCITYCSEYEYMAEYNDKLYIIYTSGSEGKPKGIVVEDSNMVNFLEGLKRRIKLNNSDAILNITTFSFDIFITETLYAMICGSRIVIVDDHDKFDMNRLMSIIVDNSVNVLQITPTMLSIILEKDATFFLNSAITILMIGGEVLSQKIANKISKFSKAQIYNMYGPTETTVWSSIGTINFDESVNIGVPIINTEMHILDEVGNEAPIGVVGEVYISGKGVTAGYLNRPLLTSERFSIKRGVRTFKTGDLAKRMSDGSIVIIGRNDEQIKIRGNRVELGEIEYQLSCIAGISDAVVVKTTDNNGYDVLVAYYCSDNVIDSYIIRECLSSKLPAYMIPSLYQKIDEIPILPSGKKDRRAIKRNQITNHVNDTRNDKPSDLECTLLNVWKKLLLVDDLHVDDDFFDLGGHSILAIKFEIEMEKIDLPFKAHDIFIYRTIRGLVYHNEAFGHEIYNKENDSHGLISSNSIIIDGVKPFNDIFFISCFYNSMFSVLDYLKCDIMHFIINTVAKYNIDFYKGVSHIEVEYVDVCPVDTLLSKLGIACETIENDISILNWIKGNVDNQCPIIAWIDAFYDPLRKDAFMKEHTKHTIVVYGYDDDDKMLHIIEHSNSESLDYKYHILAYSDFEKSYSGYKNIDDGPRAFVFSCGTNCASSNIKSLNRINDMMINQAILANNNMRCLKQCINEYVVIMNDKYELMSYIDVIIDSMNEYINAKKIEKYIFEHYGYDNILAILNKNIAQSVTIRNVLTKMMLTMNYNSSKINDLIDCLNELGENEALYYELFEKVNKASI